MAELTWDAQKHAAAIDDYGDAVKAWMTAKLADQPNIVLFMWVRDKELNLRELGCPDDLLCQIHTNAILGTFEEHMLIEALGGDT